MFEESGHIHLLSKDAKDIIEAEYYKLYSEQKAIHFIEEIEGNIVSCGGAFIKNDIPYSFFTTHFYGFIGDVYTVPECRKKGYATKSIVESFMKAFQMAENLEDFNARYLDSK